MCGCVCVWVCVCVGVWVCVCVCVGVWVGVCVCGGREVEEHKQTNSQLTLSIIVSPDKPSVSYTHSYDRHSEIDQLKCN